MFRMGKPDSSILRIPADFLVYTDGTVAAGRSNSVTVVRYRQASADLPCTRGLDGLRFRVICFPL